MYRSKITVKSSMIFGEAATKKVIVLASMVKYNAHFHHHVWPN
jgi:hypothetical protein